MIGDLIGDWLKGILIDGIMGNLSGLFNTDKYQSRGNRFRRGDDAAGMERRHF